MLKLKRVLGLSGLLGLLAAAAFAIPATADVKGECVVDGEAKTQDKLDRTIGVQLLGGEGKFTFDALSLTCVGDSNKDLIPEVFPGLDATATGWYENTVCGTGKAFGTVTEIRGGPSKFAAIEGEEFAVQFAAFQGVFKWKDWDKPPANVEKLDTESDDPRKTEYDGTPAGYILLSPPRGEKEAPTPEEELENIQQNECTKAFQATGTVAVHFAD